MLRVLLLIAIFIGAGAAYTHYFVCPCETLPGGPLSGPVIDDPVDDWSIANDREQAPLCQIEVDGGYTYSLNVNCMSHEGKLYISCSRCADKNWARIVRERPAGRIRVAGRVYNVNFSRVEDDALKDLVWQARLQKIDADDKNAPRPGGWWTFNLTSR